jgi:Holliday junction resolvase
LSSYKRIDKNQKEIVEKLRKWGLSVTSTATIHKGFPDIIVGFSNLNLLVEIKADKNSKLTPHQIDFHREWKGEIMVATTAEEILLRYFELQKINSSLVYIFEGASGIGKSFIVDYLKLNEPETKITRFEFFNEEDYGLDYNSMVRFLAEKVIGSHRKLIFFDGFHLTALALNRITQEEFDMLQGFLDVANSLTLLLTMNKEMHEKFDNNRLKHSTGCTQEMLSEIECKKEDVYFEDQFDVNDFIGRLLLEMKNSDELWLF